MDISTKKYIRKPLVVDAVQVTAQNFEAMAQWCHGEIVCNDGSAAEQVNPGNQHIRVRVHNPKTPRQTKAFVGDWILYTDRGYKIYTSKAFLSSFSEVPESEPEGVRAVTPAVAA